MSSPTGSQVWDAAVADPSCSSQMPEGSALREAIRPFFESAPTVLAEFLDRPLTLQVLADAKIAFLRYCLGNGFVEKVGGAVGMSGHLVKLMFKGLIEMWENILKDVPAFLEAQGIMEEQVMLSPKVGLNADNQKQYKAGTLTVADVLRTQPAVILKNS